MKKSLIIICVLIVAGFTEITFAQDAVQETYVLTAQQQEAVDAMISMDPKLSAKEIEQLKIAVLGAPAKAEPLSDSKLNGQPQITLAPVNAGPVEQRELVLAPVATSTTISNIPSGTQPIPPKSGYEVNLHSLSIPGAVQLEAPKSETVIPSQPAVTPGVNPQAGPKDK